MFTCVERMSTLTLNVSFRASLSDSSEITTSVSPSCWTSIGHLVFFCRWVHQPPRRTMSQVLAYTTQAGSSENICTGLLQVFYCSRSSLCPHLHQGHEELASVLNTLAPSLFVRNLLGCRDSRCLHREAATRLRPICRLV